MSFTSSIGRFLGYLIFLPGLGAFIIGISRADIATIGAGAALMCVGCLMIEVVTQKDRLTKLEKKYGKKS